MSAQVQEIPPNTAAADLITTLNVRIRQINQALGTGSAASASVSTAEGSLAARPVGLSKAEAGSLYFTADTYQVFWWTGTGWTEITPGNLVQMAAANSALTLGTVAADISGATITLTRVGRHLITGVFDMAEIGVGDVGLVFTGILVADTVAQSTVAVFVPQAQNERATVAQQWTYTAPAAGKVVKLQAKKSGAGSTSQAALQTSISAVWIGP